MSYNIGGSVIVDDVDFSKELLDALPYVYYGTENEYRDFAERLIRPSAEYCAFVYNFWRTLYTYLTPETAPEDWLRLILTEWMGWKLIPEDYPLDRLRRLLSNLHAHYKRASTVWPNVFTQIGAESGDTLTDEEGTPIAIEWSAADRLSDPDSGAGILLLLREFGVHSVVTDAPLYPDSDYYGSYGSESPLQCRVIVQYIEAWQTGSESFSDDYYDGAYAYTSPTIVDRDFVVALVEWGRVASTITRIEFETALPLDPVVAMTP